jgi:outer membrane protein OmpA-like peptidoglycan-associated protein
MAGLAATIGAIASVAAAGTIAVFAYTSTTAAKRDHDYFASRLDEVNVKLEETGKALAAVKQATPAASRQDVKQDFKEVLKQDLKHDLKHDLAAIADQIKTLGNALADMQKASSSTGVISAIGALGDKIEKTSVALTDVKKIPAAPEKPLNIAAMEKSVGALQDSVAAQSKSLDTISGSLAAVSQSLEAIKTENAKANATTANAIADAKAAIKADIKAEVASGGNQAHSAEPEKNLVVVYLPSQLSPKVGAPGAPASLSVRFDKIGSTHPAAGTATLVSDLKKIIQDRQGCIVSVVGYADTLGADNVNLDVSRQRAEAVASQLRTAFAGQNVHINKVAWGERQLKVWTPDGKGEKANRRVDIAVDCKS